ncbi:hypothetical protein [Actinomadura mexicana]|uniref:Uncharacterized protein n=1 Tax=Actinomadura mexicana TaxID=134959 RepID=A0A239DS02_9ACTN|nr:hypothetical protein [Actinomadura mexicana]SNS34513.1 hypothetical protein SAMN06265355_115106 [Actinomadura mexicana]
MTTSFCKVSASAVLSPVVETPAKAARLLTEAVADWDLPVAIKEKAPAIISFVMAHAVTWASNQPEPSTIPVEFHLMEGPICPRRWLVIKVIGVKLDPKTLDKCI